METDFKKSYFSDASKRWEMLSTSLEMGAIVDDEGYITITGRVDDVINVSGHRMGTAEIESAIKKTFPHRRGGSGQQT